LAEFHAACRSDGKTAHFGSPDAIAFNVRENFTQARDRAMALLGRRTAEHLERWQLSFLHQHDHLLRRRMAQGRVREGHGDLRLEHVYFTRHGLRIIDCIEFNERFRIADVCADLAFLSMDLAAHGRVDLAELLLARYARHADDYDLYALVDFYESYRAYVRGKIATFIGDDVAARRFFLLALSASRGLLMPPAVIAVGGVIASGKSTIAERLGEVCSAPIIDADRTRKHLAGVQSETPLREGAWQGAYDPEFTRRVYEEVFRRAGVVLASGRPVVIDASFRSRRWRGLARELARTHGVPFHFVECVAPAEVCRARLRKRAEGTSVSDGRLEIFDAFCASYEPPSELDARERITIDTSRPIPDNVAQLSGRLEAWPAGLSA
jgi:predicted kinase